MSKSTKQIMHTTIDLKLDSKTHVDGLTLLLVYPSFKHQKEDTTISKKRYIIRRSIIGETQSNITCS